MILSNRFQSRCFFLIIQMEPLASLRAQEPFILMIDTKCTSTIPITIVRSQFKPVSDDQRIFDRDGFLFVESICG